jgi:hypothetical protein
MTSQVEIKTMICDYMQVILSLTRTRVIIKNLKSLICSSHNAVPYVQMPALLLSRCTCGLDLYLDELLGLTLFQLELELKCSDKAKLL